MDTGEHGIYSLWGGFVGDGVVFHTCMEMFEFQKKANILMLGGSPYLLADLIMTGADVLFVHQDTEILGVVQEGVEGLLYPEVPGGKFRTACRDFGDDIGDLVKGASIVVCAGWLHHTPDPRTFLEQLLHAPAALIVLDTTRKLMIDIITEEMLSPRGEACPGHFDCRDAAQLVGFEIEEDILALWREISVPPTFFQYRMTCSWCGTCACAHRGKEYWFAAWGRMPAGKAST
jgi:hypothetical protein